MTWKALQDEEWAGLRQGLGIVDKTGFHAMVVRYIRKLEMAWEMLNSPEWEGLRRGLEIDDAYQFDCLVRIT